MKSLLTWTERRLLRLFRKLWNRQNFHLKAEMFSFHSKYFVYENWKGRLRNWVFFSSVRILVPSGYWATYCTDVIDAILEAIEGNKAEDLRWHKSCYAKYTDKGEISRLRKSLGSSKDTLSPPEAATSSALRSKTSSTDWELCIFCQHGSTSKKQTLCSVTTFKMSQHIFKRAKCDHDLSLRVSGVNDLIAAEGKYHPNCYKKF